MTEITIDKNYVFAGNDKYDIRAIEWFPESFLRVIDGVLEQQVIGSMQTIKWVPVPYIVTK